LEVHNVGRSTHFEANSSFHRFITELAGIERLYHLIEELRREIRKTRILSLRAPHRLDYSMREHDQILDAFLKRNPELAQAAAIKHLENQNAGPQDSLGSGR